MHRIHRSSHFQPKRQPHGFFRTHPQPELGTNSNTKRILVSNEFANPKSYQTVSDDHGEVPDASTVLFWRMPVQKPFRIQDLHTVYPTSQHQSEQQPNRICFTI